MVPALILLLAQPAPPVADLAHDSRAVRDAAIRSLAAGGPTSAAIAALLGDADERVALGAAEVLRLRRDPGILPLLARAADSPDATRGAAAAAALVATAGEALADVSTLSFPGMTVLPSRLDDAYREAVREALLPLRAPPSADRPQPYRRLLGGGAHAARALAELAADPGAPAFARAHALHAHARLTGDAPVGFLADAEPAVRVAAAQLVLRHGDEEDLARLVARLGTGTLGASELHCAALAARRAGGVGPEGAGMLERAVRDRDARVAADAAAALLAFDRVAGERALRARVLRHLAEAERVPGCGSEAAIFEVRAGPLPEDLRERMRGFEDPLLSACVSEDPVGRLRPLLGKNAGTRETHRVEIAASLLAQGGAAEADRVLFASSVLASGVSSARRAGLEALRGIRQERWAVRLPRVAAALEDPDESVRLAAAALLLPDPRAAVVCADALHDGDPWAARHVAAMLARAGLGEPDPRAPVAERRKASLEFRRKALRGKE